MPDSPAHAAPPESSSIRVFGARQHNLKNIDVVIPRGSFTVITGLSGSGKSSLAFDTIYAEGRRKYVESLSAYARQFLEQLQRPDVDRIEGLSPTIAIEQRTTGAGPRSTVATTTEIYDYLRVLFARIATPTCWVCGRTIVKQSISQMVDSVLQQPEGRRILILAPVVSRQRGNHRAVIERLIKEGYVRARINGEVAMLEEAPELPPTRKHTLEVVVDRLTVKPEIRQRLADSLELASRLGSGLVIVSAESGENSWTDVGFSSTLVCPEHPQCRVPELTPQLFSFNSPLGACEKCHGLGTTLEFDAELIVPDSNKSLRAGAIAAWRNQGRKLTAEYAVKIQEFCERFGVLPDVPFRNIPAAEVKILLHGQTEPRPSGQRPAAVGRGQQDMEGRQTSDKRALDLDGPSGRPPQIDNRQSTIANFEGVLPNLKRRWAETGSESARQRLHEFMSETPCEVCHGARLSPQALCGKIGSLSISDITRMTVEQAHDYFSSPAWEGEPPAEPPRASIDNRKSTIENFPESAAIAEPLLRAIRQRLTFLRQVGVEYLTLDRSSATLSGGEFQRIRLATQIGSGLAGVCYVLDEPTIGLHPRDTRRLTEILQKLAAADNTVIAVEHDEEVIAGATYMVDIGPGAGARGGHLVVQGPLAEALRSPDSITARFVRGESVIAPPDERRSPDWSQCIELTGVTAHNLKNINVRFPLGCLVAVSGVSGSGKSTLVDNVLLRALRRKVAGGGPRPGPFRELRGAEHIDRVAQVDQSPIGRTPRSNPATYVGAFNLIRDLFAKTREAKIRGYGPKRFSFNVKGGRCEMCEGQGVKRVSMHFLADVYVTCAECNGTRYNRETLEIRYRGKSIADVLNMSIDEAVAFFENFSNIHRRLSALKDCGLGYITLGQASNTLSGGEAQRVKLAGELHKSAETRTIYILDEPTTGLHPADVRNLLTLLHRLVDRTHTVVVIEHNLDVIKCADWVIDLGPEGGGGGGYIVAQGTPEQIGSNPSSQTGLVLRKRLNAV